MFEARIIEGKIFKQLIEAIKDLVTQANFDCSDEGMSIQAMDSSHVSLVEVKLRETGFDHYRCDRQVNIGIDSNNMSKILKCAGNDDILTLKAEDEPDTLMLQFEDKKKERTSDFEMNLVEISDEQLGIPDTEYSCTVRMPSMDFQRIIRDMATLGDTCTIACSKEGVRFRVSGDLGEGNILIRATSSSEKEEENVLIDVDEPVELTFAMRYLQHFIKATSLGPSVVISMSEGVPVVIEYPIEEIGHVKYYLAPKIDDEEEDD